MFTLSHFHKPQFWLSIFKGKVGGKYLKRWQVTDPRTGKNKWVYKYKPISQRGAHEITRERFRKVTKIADETHRAAVEKALQDGHSISMRILKDYPDLVQKYNKTAKVRNFDRISAKVKEAKQKVESAKQVNENAKKNRQTIADVPNMKPSDFKINAKDLAIRNNEINTPTPNPYKIGDIMYDGMDDNDDTGYVYELRMVDPNEIDYNEKHTSEKDVIEMESTQKYIQWLKQGIQPMPIQVIRNVDSGKLLSVNRRRLLAAREAGVKIPAFVEVGKYKDLVKNKESKPEKSTFKLEAESLPADQREKNATQDLFAKKPTDKIVNQNFKPKASLKETTPQGLTTEIKDILLKEGMDSKAREFTDRAMKAKDAAEILKIASEYVNITKDTSAKPSYNTELDKARKEKDPKTKWRNLKAILDKAKAENNVPEGLEQEVREAGKAMLNHALSGEWENKSPKKEINIDSMNPKRTK